MRYNYVVRLFERDSTALLTASSFSESSALVASSKSKIGASLKIARAIAIRCFCPQKALHHAHQQKSDRTLVNS